MKNLYLSKILSLDKMEQQPTHFGYADALLELGAKDERVVVLDSDLSKSTLTDRFAGKFPKRFFDIGIAEQNMLGMAGGLSLTGKIPFVTTYGVFLAGRAWDQIRTSICYADLNVKLAGAHGGLSVGPDGATHQALEEISIMRVLPNMKVIVPCDTHQARMATLAAAQISGPVYIRLGREPIPVITAPKTPFEFGQAQIMRPGKDVTIVACGLMVYLSLIAGQRLAKEGISCQVINLHTIKPIDRKSIIASAKKTGAVVTAEEHQLAGGMGSAVAEVLAQECPVPVEMVGVRDAFGESGQPWELMKKYHLMDADIIKAVKSAIQRKK